MVEKLPQADYDKLSQEEQKSHDQKLAEQEVAEQAGGRIKVFESRTRT